MIGPNNDGANFPHKLLLTDTKVSRLYKAFANGSSGNIKFSKNQFPKMTHSGAVLAGLLEAVPQTMFLTEVKTLKMRVKNGVSSAKINAPELAEKKKQNVMLIKE